MLRILREHVVRVREFHTNSVFGERVRVDGRVRASRDGEAKQIQGREFARQVAVWRFRLLHLLRGCLLIRG
jgi:hypothetical protein